MVTTVARGAVGKPRFLVEPIRSVVLLARGVRWADTGRGSQNTYRQIHVVCLTILASPQPCSMRDSTFKPLCAPLIVPYHAFGNSQTADFV